MEYAKGDKVAYYIENRRYEGEFRAVLSKDRFYVICDKHGEFVYIEPKDVKPLAINKNNPNVTFNRSVA